MYIYIYVYIYRFAVRAKYMALDERSNRYIKFFQNIRLIQASLTADADKYMIPKIDNTNVDRLIDKKQDQKEK